MTARLLIRCVINTVVASVTLSRGILVPMCPPFSPDPGVFYALGIAVGVGRVPHLFTCSPLACMGRPVIGTTLTAHQTSRRLGSESSLSLYPKLEEKW